MQFEKDQKSEYKQLFMQVRDFFLADDKVSELKKERITTYHYAGSALCHLRTMPEGVDIGFLKGAQLADKYQRLTGNAKKIRVLTLKKYSNKELTYYIDQAKRANVG